MENVPYSSMVPFCTLRQAFHFERQTDAKAFIAAFGPTLLLDDLVRQEDDGSFWVSVERLEDVFGE